MTCDECKHLCGEQASIDYPWPFTYCALGHWEGCQPIEGEPDPWADCNDFEAQP